MHVLLCIALHVYHGPVAPTTHVDELSNACSTIRRNEARKLIEACEAEGSQRCEVLVTESHIQIEHKVVSK